MSEGENIRVLVVEPAKVPYDRTISTLEEMQEIVGGHIEAVYPFGDDPVALVVNESRKMLDLPCNRAIMDESGLHPSRRNIRFIDSGYNDLFRVPDGGNVVVTGFDGEKRTLPCHYIDAYHAQIGTTTWHIAQFAEAMKRNGNLYRPEQPGTARNRRYSGYL